MGLVALLTTAVLLRGFAEPPRESRSCSSLSTRAFIYEGPESAVIEFPILCSYWVYQRVGTGEGTIEVVGEVMSIDEEI